MAGGGKNIWIIANWKSNKTIQEALDWVAKVGPAIPKQDNLKVVVCPTFSCLSEVKKAIAVSNFPLLIGAQDLSPFDGGAYTGEESARLLKQLVNLSLIGHSERRQNFHEDDDMVAKKVNQVLENGIIPLVCIQGKETPVPQGCKLVAYEPVWAIGSGDSDTPENDQDIARFIKSKYGNGIEVLYGGSVTSENIVHFISQQDINGALIGGASLDAEEFVRIVNEGNLLASQ